MTQTRSLNQKFIQVSDYTWVSILHVAWIQKNEDGSFMLGVIVGAGDYANTFIVNETFAGPWRKLMVGGEQ